ncbi:MAG: TonB-dependent receptor [Polyangiales bacterium]
MGWSFSRGALTAALTLSPSLAFAQDVSAPAAPDAGQALAPLISFDAGVAPPYEPLPVPPVVEAPTAEAAPEPDQKALSSVIVTGTRRTDRTVLDSNAPVDVVSANDFKTSPSPDLNTKLAQAIPSYNVQRLPLADGAIFNRPATLRGLSPDQTLVLVNGKRRHRSAYIDITLANGSQAVDMAQLPLAAISRIEVLRDGASAQYGSDAIAGVVNVLLKDKPGYDSYWQFGRYYDGDGNGYLGGINAGWELGKRGNLNLSLEVSRDESTSRSNQRPNAQALIDAGNTSVRRPVVTRYGQPDTHGVLAFLNSKYRLTDDIDAYAFGSFGYRWGENDFNYRTPTQGSVFTSSQTGATFDNNFATLPQALQDYYRNNPAAIVGYPGGFTPRFSATTFDGSAVAGLKGTLFKDLSWDLSARYGHNTIGYHIRETLNASLGPTSPRSFDTGTRKQDEVGGNLDFNLPVEIGVASPLNIAFGAEVRREAYTAETGDVGSYALGDLSRIGLAGGSNGFFGTGPSQAGTWARHSGAGYAELDADIFKRWNVSLAGRAEGYSDVGSALTGKASTRLSLFDGFNLRGNVSTGFRAPTPGQQNLTNTNQFPSADGTTIQTNGTIPATNPIARLKGGEQLKPERSLNISVGFVTQPFKDLTFSADAYRIDIRDRIGLSPRNILTPEEQAGLVASGVAAAQGLTQFNYFVNGFRTVSQGLDLVLAYRKQLNEDHGIGFTGAVNLNKTEVKDARPGVIDARNKQYFEDRLPKHVENLTLDYSWRALNVTARARIYGKWIEPYLPDTDPNTGRLLYNQKFGAEPFFDLIAAYQFNDHLRLTIGIENLFNNYPDKARWPNTAADAAAGRPPSTGRVYPSQRPYEADGGRYYARLNVTF